MLVGRNLWIEELELMLVEGVVEGSARVILTSSRNLKEERTSRDPLIKKKKKNNNNNSEEEKEEEMREEREETEVDKYDTR